MGTGIGKIRTNGKDIVLHMIKLKSDWVKVEEKSEN